MAIALQPKSHGGGYRWLPLVHFGRRQPHLRSQFPTQLWDHCLLYLAGSIPFSSDGKDLRRSYLEEKTMSDIVIKAENLGKHYVIGHQAERGGYTALRDVLMQNARTFWRKTKDLATGKPIIQGDMMEEVWALKDVSFEILRGEAVGIIGRNGAGKSTLLKVLSRITDPTTGRLTIKGRVASLLEVGTGFHPELSGRENIYLNGTILGMTRLEIREKFDEIVAFAEVEKYLDTPVKRYSSGMHVRLAFAVAAHLEPEILVVDEVLAVGDAAFQKKCLGKMGDVTHEGRTVLFVSHNMAAILSLCSEAIWLDTGKILHHGSTKETIELYMQSAVSEKDIPLIERKDRGGNGDVLLTSISVENASVRENDKIIRCTDRLRIQVGYRAKKNLRSPRFLISINDHTNASIYFLDSDVPGGLPEELPPVGLISCVTGPINITPGQCYLNVAVKSSNVLADHVQHAYNLTVEAEDFYGTGKLPFRENSLCFTEQTWLSEGLTNEN